MNKRIISLIKTTIILIVVLINPALSAAQDDRYQGDAWKLLDKEKVMASAAQVTTSKFRHDDYVVIDGQNKQVYHTDGVAESQNEIFTKVLTDKGRRDNSVFNCSYKLTYHEIRVVVLEVIKPDGTVIQVDIEANSKETINSSQMQSNIYDPDHRILRVNIPNLEIGDIVHSVVRITTVRPYIPGEFSASFALEGTAHIRRLAIEIVAPKEKPLKHILLKNEVPRTVSYSSQQKDDGTVSHHWAVTDVPKASNEPAMPPHGEIFQRLLVSTISDWQTVARWYWDLNQPHLEATTPEMGQTVKQLTSGAITEIDKVKALFYYVAKEIRYMGVTPEKDRPGLEPHDVKLTFEKKYGVCRDKAALLVAMLRMAGIEAYPVLTNVGAKVDLEVPSIAFNHAIVCAVLKNGQELLMDPTSETTQELLPIYENNQSYLVCKPTEGLLKVTPISPAEKNMLSVKTTAVMDGSGRLEAISEIVFDGINDFALRSIFAKLKPEEQLVLCEKFIRGMIPGAQVTGVRLIPENIFDMSAPLKATINFNTDSIVIFGEDKALISLPWISHNLSIVNSLLKNASLARRKLPFKTHFACGIREEITLKLPDNFTKALSLPSFTPVENEYLSYQRHYNFSEHKLKCFKEFQLKAVEFSPAEYLTLKEFLRLRDYDERKSPVFAAAKPAANKAVAPTGPKNSPPTSSDVKVLSDQRELVVKNAHAAVLKVSYRKQILTYAGKQREAELKIPYNPATQDVKLISATVTSAAGQQQQADPMEIHRMDASWNASAKRYPGGKIFVVNLPGVEIGSTISVEYEIIMQGRPFISDFESLQSFNEIHQKSFRIVAPANTQISHWTNGSIDSTVDKPRPTNKNQELTWHTGHVPPLPNETDLPPQWVYRSGVGYFIGDYSAYLKNVAKCLLKRAKRDHNAGKLALQLTQTAGTELEALKAIRDYIVKSIRSAGPSFTDLPLSHLSDADTTLADGYGHQADRAILCYAMLKAVGFQPQFLLASNLPPVAEITQITASFPLPHWFQTLLVRVVIDGEPYYINDTDQYAWLGTTPRDGKLAILLPELTYETISAARNCHEATNTTYSISLQDNGNARIKVKNEYYGMAFAEKNRSLIGQKPSNNQLAPDKHYYQKAVSAIDQGAKAVGNLDFDFYGLPGIEEFTVDIPNFGVVDGGFLYFNLPFTPSFLGTATDSRALPFYVSQAKSKTIRFEITLPQSYRQVDIAPGNESFTAPDGSGSVHIKTEYEKNSLTITYEINSCPAILTPEEYSEVKAIGTILKGKGIRMILLEK